MAILGSIVYFIVMFAIIFGIFLLCKKYVFPRVNINKWILLAIAIILLLLQMFGKIDSTAWNIISTPIIVLSFLWFMDLQQTGGPKKKEKQIVIKPKAKPNRVKNANKKSK